MASNITMNTMFKGCGIILPVDTAGQAVYSAGQIKETAPGHMYNMNYSKHLGQFLCPCHLINASQCSHSICAAAAGSAKGYM